MAGLLPNNPFSQWVDPRRNALMGFSAGMLSGDPGAAMRYAMQGSGIDRESAMQAQQQAQAEQERNATLEWVKQNAPQFANLPPAMAFEAAMEQLRQAQGGPPKPLEINGQLVDPVTYQVLGDYRTPETAKGGSAEVALLPTWLQDAKGNWVLGQLAKDGSVVQTKLPDGMRPASPGQLSGNRTAGTVDAKTAAAARAALPGAEQMKTITEQAITEVRNNSAGMKEWFSQIGPRGIYVDPGSEMGKFIAAASPTNAQAFMQARNMLKGGGQITDYEGRRAEDAISRMQAALEKGDQIQYLNAVSDFEAAVNDGYQKLLATAQGGYDAASVGSYGAAPAGAAPAVDDILSKYGL